MVILRRELAREAIEHGEAVSGDMLTTLSQAKLAFVQEILDLCLRFHCHSFASVVSRKAPRPALDVLRKDYAFLFERFYYFLEDQGPNAYGVIVFDELEKVQSKILLGQMERYFLETAKGRLRSRQIIPQPFFVHSDLTTLIQVADLVAYVSVWGLRFSKRQTAPVRTELKPFADQTRGLIYRTVREIEGNPQFEIFSFMFLNDLRSKIGKQKDLGQ